MKRFTPTVVVHPPGADVVLWGEAWWAQPARPWKLPYNRLRKARRRR